MQKSVDIPPEHALLALDTTSLRERFSNRIILARKTTNDHIDIGNINIALFVSIEYLIDILVNAASFSETFLVAAPGKLLAIVSRRFPLIRPNGLKRTRRRHIEFRIVGIAIALQTKAKASHAGKQLGNFDSIHGTFLLSYCAC